MKNIGKSFIKYICIALIVLIAFLIQTTVFYKFLIKPNILLTATCSIGFLFGEREGMFSGVLAGLFIDAFFGPLIGFNMIILISLGYLSALMGKLFYKEQILFPIILLTIDDFIYNFYYYIFRMLLRKQINFPYYFTRVFLPEIVATVLVTILIYYVLYKLDALYSKNDTGSGLNFD